MTTKQLARSDTVHSVLAVDKTKLQHAKTAAEYVLARLQTTPCSTVEDEQARADIMNRALVVIQDLEAEREVHVRPLIDDKATIDGLYRESRKPWEDVKATCKKQIEDSKTARKKAQDAARQLAAQAAQAGDTAACVAALASIPEAKPTEGTREAWEWHAMLVDAHALPREFLEVSATKINAFAKQHAKSETIPEIPGIRWERRAKVGVR